MLIKAKIYEGSYDDSNNIETKENWEEFDITVDTKTGEKEDFFCHNGKFYQNKTTCRATDTNDAEGNLIFENDRLKPADYIAADLLSEEEINPENFFSNPVVRWVPERSAFYLVSERILQTAPKIINTGKDIHADYEVDYIRTVRFVALTKDEAQHWVVYGNTIDNPDDTDYRVLPPKDADDFSDFYEDENIDDVKDNDLFEDGKD